MDANLVNLMNHFNLSYNDEGIPWLKETLNLYKNLIKIKNTESDYYSLYDDFECLYDVLPADENVDTSYLLYDVVVFCEYYSTKEIYAKFYNIIQNMKRINIINSKFYQRYYENFINYDEPDWISIHNSNEIADNGETYQYINGLIKSVKYEWMKESTIAECESRLKELISFSKGFLTRTQIEDYTGHANIVYKVLKPHLVIDYKGIYLPSTCLQYSDFEKEYLRKIINSTLRIHKIVNVNQLYEKANKYLNKFLEENKIYTEYALFSVINYLFYNDYSFSRPYITVKGYNFTGRHEVIESFVKKYKKMSVDNLRNYVHSLELTHHGTLSLIDSMNNLILFENKHTIVRLNYINFKISDFEEIEEAILDELAQKESTMAIVDLECTYWFGEYDLDWDEWFIYSVLKKWSKKITVEVTNKTLSYAVPVVSLNETIEDYELSYIGEYRKNKKIHKRKHYKNLEEIEIEVDFDDIEDLLELAV